MKRLFGTATETILALALVAAPAVLQTDLARAQAPAEAAVSIHGHVNNAAGQPLKAGDVKLATDKTSPEKDRKYLYDFPLDGNGDYKGGDIKPGDYLIVVFADSKVVDYQNMVLKAGPDLAVNFDMTREEYLKTLTPEARAAIEEVKKKNAGAMEYNAKVANLNTVMLQARADAKAGKTAEAVQAMQGATQAKPDEGLLWVTLGEVELADANAAVKAARAAKTSTSDPAILQKFTDAAGAYQKGLDLNAASSKPIKDMAGPAYSNMGEALAKAGKTQEASAAYEKAVQSNPAMASTAYYNEAAILYNSQKLEEAAAAADKGIAADPNRGDLYYIKAQSLIPKATVDTKTNKIVAPPGCVEAYQEYLALEPNGPHAAEVKDLLVNLGQPIVNSYRASKKKS